MLLAQAFVQLLQRWDDGSLGTTLDALIQSRVTVMLYQIVNRLLFRKQRLDDTENEDCPEVIAYEVLACNTLRSLPFPPSILEQLKSVLLTTRVPGLIKGQLAD